MAQRVGPVTLEDKDRDADRTIVDVGPMGCGCADVGSTSLQIDIQCIVI